MSGYIQTKMSRYLLRDMMSRKVDCPYLDSLFRKENVRKGKDANDYLYGPIQDRPWEQLVIQFVAQCATD